MSKTLVLELPDEVYDALEKAARSNGKATSEWLLDRACDRAAIRDERLRRHFGAVDLGRATGLANESLDADLARAYGDKCGEEAG